MAKFNVQTPTKEEAQNSFKTLQAVACCTAFSAGFEKITAKNDTTIAVKVINNDFTIVASDKDNTIIFITKNGNENDNFILSAVSAIKAIFED